MLQRPDEPALIVAQLELDGCPPGPVLAPLASLSPTDRQYFAGWETPLAPWGGFRLPSNLAVVAAEGGPVLELNAGQPGSERALVTASSLRDGVILAEVKPLAAATTPHVDRNDPPGALIGVVFRMVTSRHYYQFGLEAQRRAVLYRRMDDEWAVLAAQELAPVVLAVLEAEAGQDVVEVRIRQVLAASLKITPAEIQPDQRLIEDLGADSLDLVEVVMASEEELGGRIPEDEAAQLTTVGDVMAYVRHRRQAPRADGTPVTTPAERMRQRLGRTEWPAARPGYVTLAVQLDADGIRCQCPELAVDFFVTDTLLPAGKAGVRALGPARVARMAVTRTPTQQARDDRRHAAAERETAALGADLPDPVEVRCYRVADLGGRAVFQDFVVPGRHDLLILGPRPRALGATGDVLWELPDLVLNEVVFTRAGTPDEGRLIYGLAGERKVADRVNVTGAPMRNVISESLVVIRGRDGAVLATTRLPEMHATARYPDFVEPAANFTGHGDDIVLREWREDLGGGGIRLWAYDRHLHPLWERELPAGRAPYGHHWALALEDVDGDGRDELLAGGTMLDADGRELWVHDRNDEMARINGAHHYDAVALGRFAGEAALDPVAFLCGGSAGVYVVDALTGQTRAVHRIGHAQGRIIGRVRSDCGSAQVLAVTRWGNMGILTLFSGAGDRLWTLQPDYLGQGAAPVHWGLRPEALIWTNTSRGALGFYDGAGRRVKELPALQQLWGERLRNEVDCAVVRLGADPHDLLALTVAGELHLFGPAPR